MRSRLATPICYCASGRRVPLEGSISSSSIKTKPAVFCHAFAMRSSLLLFSFFVACTGSLRDRDCVKNPKDCDHEILQFDNTKDTTEQVGMDQDLLENLRFFSQFAAAAYWPGNNNSTGDLLRCSSDSCPKAPAGNCPDVEK